MTLKSIARLTVTLLDVEPAVSRIVEVPSDIRLDRLHDTLQAALGWTNSHLWEIRACEIGWGIPDPDWLDGPLDATKATLWDIVQDTGMLELLYLYDFGDGWEHSIEISLEDAVPETSYPILRKATGRCPPEDVGGPWGYADGLEALHDHDHERHEEITEWWPQNFDPKKAPVTELKHCVASLHKQ